MSGDLVELARKINDNAVRNKWWDPGKEGDSSSFHGRNYGELMALITSELTESLEEDRILTGRGDVYYAISGAAATAPLDDIRKQLWKISQGKIRIGDLTRAERFEAIRLGYLKPMGRLVELADALIRLLDVMYMMAPGSFELAIEEKMLYNESRPVGHGKRY